MHENNVLYCKSLRCEVLDLNRDFCHWSFVLVVLVDMITSSYFLSLPRSLNEYFCMSVTSGRPATKYRWVSEFLETYFRRWGTVFPVVGASPRVDTKNYVVTSLGQTFRPHPLLVATMMFIVWIYGQGLFCVYDIWLRGVIGALLTKKCWLDR